MATFAVENPATREQIAELDDADAAAVDGAVRARMRPSRPGRRCRVARAAGSSTGSPTCSRSRRRRRRARELRQRPAARETSAQQEIIPHFYRYFAGWADKIEGDDDPRRRRLPQLHRAGPGRRLRRDHAVEPSAADRDEEDRAGTRLRQRRRRQAERAGAALGRRVRSHRARGRPARGRAPGDHRPARHRRGADPAPGHRPHRPDRLDCDGIEVQQQSAPTMKRHRARARRQGGEHRLRRCRFRAQRSRAPCSPASSARARRASQAHGFSSSGRCSSFLAAFAAGAARSASAIRSRTRRRWARRSSPPPVDRSRAFVEGALGEGATLSRAARRPRSRSASAEVTSYADRRAHRGRDASAPPRKRSSGQW